MGRPTQMCRMQLGLRCSDLLTVKHIQSVWAICGFHDWGFYLSRTLDLSDPWHCWDTESRKCGRILINPVTTSIKAFLTQLTNTDNAYTLHDSRWIGNKTAMEIGRISQLAILVVPPAIQSAPAPSMSYVLIQSNALTEPLVLLQLLQRTDRQRIALKSNLFHIFLSVTQQRWKRTVKHRGAFWVLSRLARHIPVIAVAISQHACIVVSRHDSANASSRIFHLNSCLIIV